MCFPKIQKPFYVAYYIVKLTHFTDLSIIILLLSMRYIEYLDRCESQLQTKGSVERIIMLYNQLILFCNFRHKAHVQYLRSLIKIRLLRSNHYALR